MRLYAVVWAVAAWNCGVALATATPRAQEPTKLIIDTDAGFDVDDVGG
jgi:hypothetical protein